MAATKDVVARLRADPRKLTPDLRKAQNKFKKFGKRVSRNLKKSFSKATGVLKSVAGIGGIIGFASIGRDVLDFEDKLQRVGSQALFTRKRVAELRNDITKMSDASGLSRDALVGGLGVLVNLQGATAVNSENLDTMSKALLGTGAEAADVAGIMFALNENLGVTKDEMLGVLSAVDRIGAEASIPFAQLASELASLTGQAARFGIQGKAGTADLVASLQKLVTKFKGTSEAATGIAGAFTAIERQEKVLLRLGVVTRGANGEFRNMVDLFTDIGRNEKVLKKGLLEVLRRPQAVTAVRTIAELSEKIRDLSKLGQDAPDFLDERAADRLNSEVGRINKSWTNVKNTLAKVLTPERIDTFASAMEKLAKAVEFVVDNIVLFAGAWAAVKIGTFAVQLSTMATAAGATGLAGALGKASGAVGVLGAAFAGFTIGTALDEALGLSDAISDALVGFEKLDARADTAFTRQLVKNVATGGFGIGGAVGVAQAAGAQAAGALTPRQKSALISLAGPAAGLVTDEGTVNEAEARRVATQGLGALEIAASGDALTRQIVEAVKLGIIERDKSAAARATAGGSATNIQVTGVFKIDQNGNAILEEPRVKKNRRQVTQ